MSQRPLQNYCHSFQTALANSDPSETGTDQPPNDEELPLEEIEQILAEEGTVLSRKEMILVLKINQLQTKCSRLALTNRHLSKQIQDLEEDVFGEGQVQINENIAQEFLESVEQQLQDYRSHFHDYRTRQQTQLKAKDVQIDKMNQQLQEMSKRLQLAEQQRAELERSNEQLSRDNQELGEEVDELQERLEQAEGRRGKGFRKGKFEGEVQAELESLIDKLVSELETERWQKKRLSQEIKRMQQEMLEMERDLAIRNNKIYTLEMQALRANRPNPNTHSSPTQLNHSAPNNQILSHHSDRSTSALKANSQVKNFSLMELMNQEVDISEEGRLVLGSKVVDYYIRKMGSKDYSTLMLQDILICNFHHMDPQLSFIRRNKRNSEDSGELTQQRLVWNLAFILDNLINHNKQDRQRAQTNPELAQLINNILQETTAGVEDVYALKELLEEALGTGN